jgi:drug/metabolite transporter (DMT)-like permease
MKPGTIIGLILIVLGVVGFALGGFSFTHKEKVVDVGPIEATADDKETVPIPPILAGLALVGGVVLVAASARRT